MRSDSDFADFGAVSRSVTERSCYAPILEVESRMSDRFLGLFLAQCVTNRCVYYSELRLQ